MSDDYSRNRIRHSIIDNMSLDDKLDMLNKIRDSNIKLKKHHDSLFELVDNKGFKYSDIAKLDDKLAFLRVFFSRCINGHLSQKCLLDVLKQLDSGKNFVSAVGGFYFVRSYDHCYIIDELPKDYYYVINKIQEVDTSYFKIRTSGDNLHGVSVSEDDFPLVIRNAKDSDAIVLRYGTKKI